MLFKVSGGQSSPSLPGTFTRPLFDPWLNCRWLPFVATKIHPSSSRRRMICLNVVGTPHERPVVPPRVTRACRDAGPLCVRGDEFAIDKEKCTVTVIHP
jgi:hypothetical protein